MIEIGLVLATLGLVWATWKLAQYTRTLADLTQQMVRIETKRDDREAREIRRSDLIRGLAAAEQVQSINAPVFAANLNKPLHLPLTEMGSIEVLQSIQTYIWDTECQPVLNSLCSTFDSVRREKFKVKQNVEDIARKISFLQGRIQWFVDEARYEIATGKPLQRVNGTPANPSLPDQKHVGASKLA